LRQLHGDRDERGITGEIQKKRERWKKNLARERGKKDMEGVYL